jgi:hypothetical protein
MQNNYCVSSPSSLDPSYQLEDQRKMSHLGDLGMNRLTILKKH